ncbi:hypothetical protein GALMADRAFT_214217 [Galerina marginata CBS 339.88]|uniref:Uncharacterized protein n=1 Tax=Galerina marginata (strain CBS 339.88) TaxID=685588 RepID=A0A067SIR4_GALM3|nr:hypothetical protein GALMADRAFT_214217 [Galerina marginata CBS 339.88]
MLAFCSPLASIPSANGFKNSAAVQLPVCKDKEKVGVGVVDLRSELVVEGHAPDRSAVLVPVAHGQNDNDNDYGTKSEIRRRWRWARSSSSSGSGLGSGTGFGPGWTIISAVLLVSVLMVLALRRSVHLETCAG